MSVSMKKKLDVSSHKITQTDDTVQQKMYKLCAIHENTWITYNVVMQVSKHFSAA